QKDRRTQKKKQPSRILRERKIYLQMKRTNKIGKSPDRKVIGLENESDCSNESFDLYCICTALYFYCIVLNSIDRTRRVCSGASSYRSESLSVAMSEK